MAGNGEHVQFSQKKQSNNPAVSEKTSRLGHVEKHQKTPKLRPKRLNTAAHTALAMGFTWPFQMEQMMDVNHPINWGLYLHHVLWKIYVFHAKFHPFTKENGGFTRKNQPLWG